MSFELWLSYVAALTILSLIPGPSVFMVVSQSLTKGARAGWFCILGDVLGGLVMMSAAILGLGAVLAASSMLFLALKWAGVLYLAWLGAAQILAARRMTLADIDVPNAKGGHHSSLRAGFFVGVLNPKAILFYGAFLVQFVDPSAPLVPQAALLMATSTVVVVAVLGAYTVLAARARMAFRTLQARKRLGYLGGGALLGGAGVLAST